MVAAVSNNPSLSIVVPVFNEPEWIVQSVARAAEAARASRWSDPEAVVVDDGSTDETAQVVDRLECSIPLRVLHQQNRGRFLARQAGIEAARGDYVLLVDARVLVGNGLDELLDRAREGKAVWTSDCQVSTEGNLLAKFWDAPPRIFWRAYFNHPRRVSFGVEDFHKYPKGTTCFLAPRAVLIGAYEQFSSQYSDLRHANDDTLLIGIIAREQRIWISPEFTCRYEPRRSVRRFIPHAYHRGIVFVDGFLRPGNPFAPAILAFYAATLAIGMATFRRKATLPAAYLGITAAAVAAGAGSRLPPRHLAALAAGTPLFVTAYGAGMWAGLGMVVRKWIQTTLRPAFEGA